MLTVDSRRFIRQKSGIIVKKMLVKEFAEVFDVGFTADMELSLDKIETGDREWVSVLKIFTVHSPSVLMKSG